MRVLLDTNVVLDVFLDREPHATHVAQILSQVVSGSLSAVVGATTVTTIYYLATRKVGRRAARELLVSLLQLTDIAAVNRSVLSEALGSEFNDFEDAVLYYAGLEAGIAAIISRDKTGFRSAEIPVFTPLGFLQLTRS